MESNCINFFCMVCAITLVWMVTILGQADSFEKMEIGPEINSSQHDDDFQENTWICTDDQCEKSTHLTGTSFETCSILCGFSPPLWPKPKQTNIVNKNSTCFFKEHIFLKIHSPVELKSDLEEAANIFLGNLKTPSNRYKLIDGEANIVKLNLHVKSSETLLTSSTNESYILYSQKFPDHVLVSIFAQTYFGARCGLETLTQLIWYDTQSERLRILHDVEIKDEPMFRHRGILIDTARNFFPISHLKRAVDGMAAAKINVLHLHLTDAVSFPVILPNNRRFAERGAYGKDMTYSPEDMKDLIYYARIRGIKTILEIDAPSHVNTQAFPKGMVICGESDIFNGHINPDDPKSLDTLQSLYEDLLELGTDKETFHIGNDEVNTYCWRNTQKAKTVTDVNYLWADFTNEMIERVKLANNGSMPKNIVLWSSPLTDRLLEFITQNNKDQIVVQYWFGQFKHILESGVKMIFSTVGQWYLDCGFGPWKQAQANGVCDPFTHWLNFYKYRPWSAYPKRLNQVLGGEACLWSEQVSPSNLDTKLWPRAAAFAERLWSDPDRFYSNDVFRRLSFHSKRLEERGIGVAALWPRWCHMNPEKC